MCLIPRQEIGLGLTLPLSRWFPYLQGRQVWGASMKRGVGVGDLLTALPKPDTPEPPHPLTTQHVPPPQLTNPPHRYAHFYVWKHFTHRSAMRRSLLNVFFT